MPVRVAVFVIVGVGLLVNVGVRVGVAAKAVATIKDNTAASAKDKTTDFFILGRAVYNHVCFVIGRKRVNIAAYCDRKSNVVFPGSIRVR